MDNPSTKECSSNQKSFESTTNLKSQFKDLDDDPAEIECLLCKEKYILPDSKKAFLSHVFVSHRLVIGDVEKISSLKSYIHYWRTKFRDDPLVNFCTTMVMDCTPDGKESKNEAYFLLSDDLPEDKTLRDEIHRAKLDWILSVQAQERSDTSFRRGCMFCKTEFSGPRSVYLKHLSEKHNIQLGRPENLVFVDRFLDKIEENITKLICIYCEKSFKSRMVLREHMRKKMHKRVNPSNNFYDKFYLNNYLLPGNTSVNKSVTNDENSISKENISYNDVDDDDDEDNIDFENKEYEEDWDDWKEECIAVTCLFCTYSNGKFSEVLRHMSETYDFDFDTITADMDFYEKIKVVNYIRHQIHSSLCIFCNADFADNEGVVDHMKKKNHCKLPESKAWLQPEFYFPILDDDSFLYILDTDDKQSEIRQSNIEESFAESVKIVQEDE